MLGNSCWILILAVTVAFCAAETPQYRWRSASDAGSNLPSGDIFPTRSYRPYRPRQRPTQPEGDLLPPARRDSAGYPVAGFRPTTSFDLPLEPQQVEKGVVTDNNNNNQFNARRRRPADTYGPPKPHDTYGVPHATSGPPAAWSTARVPFSQNNFLADTDYFEQKLEPQFAAVATNANAIAEAAAANQQEQPENPQILDVPFALLQLPVEVRSSRASASGSGY